MSDHFADRDLERPTPVDPGGAPPRPRLPAGLLVIAGALLVALGIGYVYLWRTPSQPADLQSTARPPVTAPVQSAEPGEQIVLPPLDETDPVVRQLVERLSSYPAVAAWLTTDGLILNFVTVTSRIASGETPVSDLKAVGPIPPFRIRKSGDAMLIDPSSYSRYDRHAAAVSSLDARGTARLYATLKPRIEEAYARIGPPESTFDRVLERAIVELLEVPVVNGDVALAPHGTVYAFEDERLQTLSAAQKQLLRMGPQHVRAVQTKLREIASHLGIPASRLPPPT